MARSVVVLDVKQENWDATAGFRPKAAANHLLFNPLDAAGRTCRYNPFSHIDRRDEVDVINELQKIGAMLFPPPRPATASGPKARGQHSWRCRLCRGNRR
jgi:type IV secretion system protein VirD4